MSERDLEITPAEVESVSASMAKMLEEGGGGALAADLANACRMISALALMVEKLAEQRRDDLDRVMGRVKALEAEADQRRHAENGEAGR